MAKKEAEERAKRDAELTSAITSAAGLTKNGKMDAAQEASVMKAYS